MVDTFNPIPQGRLVYKTVTFIVPANTSLPVNVQFQQVKVISCSNDAAIKGQIAYSTDSVDMSVGLGYGVTDSEKDEGKFYNAIVLQNITGLDVTIKLTFAFGNVTDDRITIGGSVSSTIVGSVPISGTTATPLQDFADAALAAATLTTIRGTATRRGFIVGNVGANPVRIGSAVSVGATQGAQLLPGQSLTIETLDAIGAYSVLGTTVSRLEY